MKILCPNCLNTAEIEAVQENEAVTCPICAQTFVPTEETPLPDTAVTAEPIPESIGRFPVKRLIGRGGMCSVYEGIHPELNIPVALKVPRAKYIGDAEFCARFKKSSKICAKISHPNIVKVYEYGEDALTKVPYLVMEYIGGGSICDFLFEHGCCSEEKTVQIAHAICQGLLIAEKHGIVHRDIKPDNIMISDDGQYKLSDLGLAKQEIMQEDYNSTAQTSEDNTQCRTGSMYSLGTLEFMPPEQLLNAATCDSRADIYSLGVTMYQMATCRLPLECGENEDFRQILLTRNPCVPSKYDENLSLLFDYIVMTCMQKTRRYRYQSFRELLDDLEAYLDGKQELPSMHVAPPVLCTRPNNAQNSAPVSKLLVASASVLGIAVLALTTVLAVKLMNTGNSKQVTSPPPVAVQQTKPQQENTVQETTLTEAPEYIPISRNAESAQVTVTTMEDTQTDTKTRTLFQECREKAAQAIVNGDGYNKIIKELRVFSETSLKRDAENLITELEYSKKKALEKLMLELDSRAAPLLQEKKWDQAIKVYYSNITSLKEESQELRAAKIKEIEQQRKDSFQSSVIPMETHPM